MKIVCCLKHAPDSNARLSIAGDGQDINQESIDFNPSPFDEYGIEAAMQIKENGASDAEIVILCLGPESAVSSIRKALAMGGDRALHIVNDQTLDSRAIAKALAEVLKEESPDLVLFGHQAIDTNAGQVPAYVAEALGLGLVSTASSVTIADGKATCERPIEGAIETVVCSLPIAISCTKGGKEPRFPSLPGIMKAKKKPLDVKEVTITDNLVTRESMALPPQRQAGSYIGEGVDGVAELVNRLRNEAKVI